jgi:hypothetical protein
MEGASLRGPETLPPWNLVFKSPIGARKLFHLALTMVDPRSEAHNPSSAGFFLVIENNSYFIKMSRQIVTQKPPGAPRAATIG